MWESLIPLGASLLGGAAGSLFGGDDGGMSGADRQAMINMNNDNANRSMEAIREMMKQMGTWEYGNSLNSLLGQANYLNGNQPLYTGDPGLNGLTTDMDTALKLISERALKGNAGLDTAKSILGATAQGDYLNPDTNPYLSYFAQKAQEQALPTYDTSAINAGRYGSNSYYSGKNNLLSDIANNIYGNAYQGERQNQLSAAQLLPQIYEMDYNDYSKLLDAGNTRRTYAEQATNEPWTRLQTYQGLINNNYPSVPSNYGYNANSGQMLGSTYNTQGSPNTASNILGGAAAGYGLGNMFKSSFTPTASASTGTSSVWSNLFPTGAYSGKSLLG